MTYDPETMPWRCDDKDCPHEWHLAFYNLDEPAVSRHGDGDWEGIDEYPPHEEFAEAWNEYHRWVAEHGTDPLHAFMTTYRRKGVWQVLISASIVGLIFNGARRSGRGKWILDAAEIPAEVRDYFQLQKKRGTGNRWLIVDELLPGIDALDAAARQGDEVLRVTRRHGSIKITVEIMETRHRSVGWLKKKAKSAILTPTEPRN